MGAEFEGRKTTSAEPLIPPGFASLTSFFLKEVKTGNKRSRYDEYTVSSGAKALPAKDPPGMIDSEKLKSSLRKRPWIVYDESNQLAEGSKFQKPNKVTATWSLNDLQNDMLEVAPAFYPTEKEFRDTLKYIESIRDKAEKYGICRIIPPSSWKPHCLLKEDIIWKNSVFVTESQQFIGCPPDRNAELHSNMNGLISKSGPEFTLEAFEKHGCEFVKNYFSSKDNALGHDAFLRDSDPVYKKIELEFWKLVYNRTKDVEVHYGSDVDTGAFGSGFPVLSDPLERSDYPEYLCSGWNLNNLPRSPSSLLCFESTQTSGLTMPRLSIGMCFSSFCWRAEEHHLYSLSYMHMGSPKVRYAAPGAYFGKFDAAMKKCLSDAIDRRYTRLPPFILKSENLPIFRCIQKPGEFVLTFPGAYHSGFDCGFNCVETVSFAPLDWLPHGQMAVELCQEQKRKTSISHDKVLISAAREVVKALWKSTLEKKRTSENLWKDASGKNSIIAEALKSRVKLEGARRKHLCVDSQSRKMDESFDGVIKRECVICFYDLHLSAAHCPCSADRYSCLQHAKQLCSCAWSEKVFLYRYSSSQLNILVEAVEGKISAVVKWAREDPEVGLLPLISGASGGSEQEEHMLREDQRSDVGRGSNIELIRNEIKQQLHSRMLEKQAKAASKELPPQNSASKKQKSKVTSTQA